MRGALCVEGQPFIDTRRSGVEVSVCATESRARPPAVPMPSFSCSSTYLLPACPQVKEVPAAQCTAAWADEFDAQPGQQQNGWASEFQAAQQPAGQRWAAEFDPAAAQRPPAFATPAAADAAEAAIAGDRQDWAAEFGREGLAEGGGRWADDFANGVAGMFGFQVYSEKQTGL